MIITIGSSTISDNTTGVCDIHSHLRAQECVNFELHKKLKVVPIAFSL